MLGIIGECIQAAIAEPRREDDVADCGVGGVGAVEGAVGGEARAVGVGEAGERERGEGWGAGVGQGAGGDGGGGGVRKRCMQGGRDGDLVDCCVVGGQGGDRGRAGKRKREGALGAVGGVRLGPVGVVPWIGLVSSPGGAAGGGWGIRGGGVRVGGGIGDVGVRVAVEEVAERGVVGDLDCGRCAEEQREETHGCG